MLPAGTVPIELANAGGRNLCIISKPDIELAQRPGAHVVKLDTALGET